MEKISTEENGVPKYLTIEETNGSEEVETSSISIPLGGPIYVPNLVGSLTTVPEFEAAVLHLLQDLEAELLSDSSLLHENISVDELKIFSEEELVSKALNEAFQVDEEVASSPQLPELQICHDGSKDICVVPTEDATGPIHLKRRKKTVNSIESTNGSITGPGSNGRKRQYNFKNVKNRRPKSSNEFNDTSLAYIKRLAKIKEKQDEDKAAANLHSFNSSCKNNKCTITPSEKLKKMTALRSKSSVIKVKSSNIREHIALDYPEVVLCVEVYHSIHPWSKTQEFLVLGRQTLTELRDNIYCVMDRAMQDEDQHDPSGYFLIEDVFCNDLRDRSAIDYSEPIFDWLKNSKDEVLEKWEYITSGCLQQKQRAVLGHTNSQLPNFRALDMHKTRFCDLKFRLGANYLYCHQGDCKHTIVIRDMRLIHPEDAHNRAVYPLLTFQHKNRVRKCSVCKIYLATKVTVNDKWAQGNPCYFCDYCYHFLHYSAGNLLHYSDFETYKYYHE